MKVKKMSIFGVLLPLICSCNTKTSLQKEIDVVNEECNFRLGMKLEDFPPSWKEKYHPGSESNENFHLQKNNDGIDIYNCGTENGFTTEFYFKDGLEIGFRTRDPGFGFSVFGKTIGYPCYGSAGHWEDSAFYILINRGYSSCSHHREPTEAGDGYVRYAWYEYNFEDRLHIHFSCSPIYTFDGNIIELEVFLEA